MKSTNSLNDTMSNFTQKEIDYLNRSIVIKEIKFKKLITFQNEKH